MVPGFKNVRKRSTAKNYPPVSLLSVACRVFETLLNNRLVDHLQKCGLFTDFSIISGLLDQLQTFWQLYLIELLGLLIGLGILVCLLHKLNSYGISDLVFGFISSFLSDRWLTVVLEGKFS